MILSRPRRRSGGSRRGLALLAPLSLVALVACGEAERSSDGAASAGAAETRIVATTSIWADITSNVACGAPVTSLVPAGADPHSYEPSLRDRETATDAAVITANGSGLEGTIDDLLDAAIADGVNVVEVATHIDLLAAGAHRDEHAEDDHADEAHAEEEHTDEEHAEEEHAEEEHTDAAHTDDEHTDATHTDGEQPVDDGHGHDHGDGDPHVWQDPTRIAGALDVISSALAAAEVDTCGDEYREELMALDAEIAEILAPIPAEDRLLVTSHDSLAYFADRYDFEVLGTVIPSTSTMGETSAGELAELAELVDEHSVDAIFTDAFESASDAEALADRLGIPVVPLVTDALTPDAPTYAELMRSNAATIAAALTP